MESLTEEDPSWIGGYELRARLGEGGFGLVYLALSPAGRVVALKVLRREFARDREFLGRFRLEVAAVQRVNGIYTAPVVASGLDDRPPWVATAFVPGPPLNHIVFQSGPLPEPALWRLLAGLVEALHAIHACGIVHRDLKPANILLAADGPRVIDFGISKAADETSMTSTGAVFGTPGFMAPEQAEAKIVGPATDVFALGCVLAYASSGVPPFGGGSAASVLYRVVHSAPALDGVPPYLRGIIEMCLAKEPAARPGLNDLASIGRDGPDGMVAGHFAASFWPPQFARLIREYQERLDVTITTGKVAGGPSPAQFASSARSFAGTTHPPTAAPPTPPGRNLPPGGPGYGYARTDSMGRGVASPDTWQPHGAPPYSQFPNPPFQPAGQRIQPGVQPPFSRPGGSALIPAVPGTVRGAIAVMRVGAALAALTAIAVAFDLGFAYNYAGSALLSYGGWSPFTTASLPGTLLYAIECGLWLWVAQGVKAGQQWTRIVTAVLLGVLTLLVAAYNFRRSALYTFAPHSIFGGYFPEHIVLGTLGGPLTLLIGLTGCAAVVLLWLRSSGQYFRTRQNHGY